jgi:hypothetical protein
MAKACRMGRNTAYDCLKLLIKHRLIEKEPHTGKPSNYYLTPPSEWIPLSDLSLIRDTEPIPDQGHHLSLIRDTTYPQSGTPPIPDQGHKGINKGNPINLPNEGAIDRRKNEAIDVERWKETYNSHKPLSFAAVQVFNAKRLTTIKSLIKDCGGQENALTALSNALDYVSNEPWYQGKDLSFDNFASNGKILQFHERWVSGNGKNLTPLARNAESNLDYLRNLETRYAT